MSRDRPPKKSRKPASALQPAAIDALLQRALAFHQQGQLARAEPLYRKILAQAPEHFDALHLLGVLECQHRRLLSALALFDRAIRIDPDYAAVHSNRGLALSGLERLEEAIASYDRALAIEPGLAEAFNNRGNVLKDLQRPADALASYERALAIEPDYVDALNNRGVALRELKRLEEALASYDRALAVMPEYAEALSNRGVALHELQHLEDALASYDRALAAKPVFAEALLNRGNVLRDLERPREALASYDRALAIEPGLADALANRGLVLQDLGRYAEAIPSILRSLQIEEKTETKKLFVQCMKHLDPASISGPLKACLLRALSEPWERPAELMNIGVQVLQQDRRIWQCIARAAKAWPQRLSAPELFAQGGGAEIAADALLKCLLVSAPITSIEMERFLTMARKASLDAASASDGASAEEAGLGFYASLAQQCYINEYLYDLPADETERAVLLRDRLCDALQTDARIPANWLVAVAAYFPLQCLSSFQRILDRHWPEPVTALINQQIVQPEQERQCAQSIPQLTPISGEVSLLVKHQYEENPYPRWLKASPPCKPVAFDEHIRRSFPWAGVHPLGRAEGLDILIAGCGTGQHPIEVAQGHGEAHVLAIDLSRASLGYAGRKANELGLANIQFAQADIMELGAIDRRFDVIESVGVLHHLAEPNAGWRILLELLRSGGFMRLGLYSETGRRNITLARAWIAEQGFAATGQGIRNCRQSLLGLEPGCPQSAVLGSRDFFSLSECRDLLFHVHEQPANLTGIRDFVRENKLRFLGFDIARQVLQAYRLRFPDDRAATNLDYWQAFENDHPDTFVNMYQFWLQKP